MLSSDYPQLCPTCQGYKTMPYAWSSTNQPRLCSCPKPTSLAWKCTRCGKINAPWKESCNCTPTPFGAPTSGTQPYIERGNPYLDYFPDSKGPTTITSDIHKK